MKLPLSSVRIDDADLALIEINTRSAIVQRLVWEIRRLQDELTCAQARVVDLEHASCSS